MNAPLATFDCRQAFAETLADLARAGTTASSAVCNDSVGVLQPCGVSEGNSPIA